MPKSYKIDRFEEGIPTTAEGIKKMLLCVILNVPIVVSIGISLQNICRLRCTTIGVIQVVYNIILYITKYITRTTQNTTFYFDVT